MEDFNKLGTEVTELFAVLMLQISMMWQDSNTTF